MGWAWNSRLDFGGDPDHDLDPGFLDTDALPVAQSTEGRVQYKCSEISCNVKLNVYLAMEIPDHVSFVSGQNSDEIVRSCELS